MRVVLSTPGRPTACIALARSEGLPTACQGAVAIPAPFIKLFSATRSWLMRKTAGDGRTGEWAASNSRPSALKFEGDDVHRSGKIAQRAIVFVIGTGCESGNLGGWAVFFGCEDVAAIAKPCCRHGHHAAELAAADDPDRAIGRKRAYHVGIDIMRG